MTTDPVTRSVEIPEEAVRDAIAAFDDFEMRAMNAIEDQDVHLEDAMRAAIAAALPYLAPAEVVIDHRPGETCSVAAEVDPETGFARAPAGDGGLREALERICDDYSAIDIEMLQETLAAHPAAHAVSTDTTESTASTSAVPQPVDRTRHAIWRAVYSAAIAPGLQPSGIADKATEAVLALAAQPVDREALTRMLAETVFHCFDDEEFGLSAKHAVAVSDAVAAVLAGEQEQVEP